VRTVVAEKDQRLAIAPHAPVEGIDQRRVRLVIENQVG